MSSDGKGYLTPDPPDPYDLICIKVFVPNHRLYIAAFWGAYQFMTNWNAWARDPLKKGKRAALIWKDAFDKARAHWNIFKGDCGDMINNIRTKPLHPCVLQILDDDGIWQDVFDASCCGDGGGHSCEQLRIAGGQIQRYNTETEEWENAGPETPAGEIPTADPPYTPSSNGACLAATNFGALIEGRKNILATNVGTLMTFGEAFLSAYDIVISLTGMGWVLSAIGTLWQTVYSEMSDNYAAVGAYDITALATCLSITHYAPDGSMTQHEVDELLIEIQALQNTFDNPSPERTAWGYVYSWVKAAGAEGMQTAANFMGITVGACDDCIWTQTFDFRVSAHGFHRGDFEADPLLDGKGIYQPGQGWRTELVGGRPFCHPRLEIEMAKIIKYSIQYTGVVGPDDGAAGLFIQTFGLEITGHWESGTNTVVAVYEPYNELPQVEFRLDGYDGIVHPESSCVVHKLTVTGLGQNPFTAMLPPTT